MATWFRQSQHLENQVYIYDYKNTIEIISKKSLFQLNGAKLW